MSGEASARDPVPGEVGRPRVPPAVGVSIVRRGAAAARDREPKRPAEEHGVPAALHARAMRHGRQGRRKPLSLLAAPVQTEALPARLRRAGHRLSVLEGGLAEPRARRRGGGRRAHLARQPLQPEDRPAQRRHSGARKGRPGHRVPDRRARRADRRGQVPRGEHSADRDRGAAPRRDLLRREQLRGRADRRPLSSDAGRSSTGTPTSTRSS